MSQWRFFSALGLLALGLANGCGPVPSSPAKPQSITTASGVLMIVVPAGSFQMGSNDHEADERPRHEVRLGSFLMDQFEVTHDLFVKAQLPNPSRWQDDSRKPVERVRWREAKLYCNERSLMENLTPCYDEAKPGWPCDFAANGYRLPTEAEWEYAARAGSSRLYSFGDVAKLKANSWFAANAGKRTHVV
ncbi:MAG: SUMF1/EgtB/PvdO family nonheme iron enzyme, partial [Verrucomicrobia bacterium]|nr:SUMF1/EgtB/PvdO family nonheme iron enzyme [Verrucomicrobiota bacterium]